MTTEQTKIPSNADIRAIIEDINLVDSMSSGSYAAISDAKDVLWHHQQIIEGLAARVMLLEGDKARVSEILKVQDRKIEDLEKQVGDLQSENFDNNVGTTRVKVIALAGDVADLKTRVDQLSNQSHKYRERITRLDAVFKSLEGEVRDDRISAQRQIKTLGDAFNDYAAKLVDLRTKVETQLQSAVNVFQVAPQMAEIIREEIRPFIDETKRVMERVEKIGKSIKKRTEKGPPYNAALAAFMQRGAVPGGDDTPNQVSPNPGAPTFRGIPREQIELNLPPLEQIQKSGPVMTVEHASSSSVGSGGELRANGGNRPAPREYSERELDELGGGFYYGIRIVGAGTGEQWVILGGQRIDRKPVPSQDLCWKFGQAWAFIRSSKFERMNEASATVVNLKTGREYSLWPTDHGLAAFERGEQ